MGLLYGSSDTLPEDFRPYQGLDVQRNTQQELIALERQLMPGPASPQSVRSADAGEQLVASSFVDPLQFEVLGARS